MKNKIKWFKAPSHLAFALLLAAILGIAATIAMFTDLEAAVNRITTGKIEIETDEEAGALTKTKIGVTSTGKSECYVRMRVDVPTVKYKIQDIEKEALIITLENREYTATEWGQLETGASLPAALNSGTSSWIKREDGYWYLNTTFNQNESAKILSKITYPDLWDMQRRKVVDPLPDGLTMDMLSISIVSEAVQVEGIDVGGATGAEAAYKAFKAVNGQR